MRVLFVVSTLKRGGPTTQLLNTLLNLDCNAFSAVVLTLSPEPRDSRYADFVSAGIEVATLGRSRIVGAFRNRSLLAARIREVAPDIIHSQGFRADTLLGAMKLPVPHLAVMRNFPQQDYPMTYGKLMGAWMARRHGHALAQADACVGVSDAVSENLRRHFRLANVRTIRNGVDTKRYSPQSPEGRRVLRQELGLPVDALIWVATGHLSELKNTVALIQAFKAGMHNPGAHLLLVGGGPLESDCRRAAGDDRRILFAGRVSDVSRYLQVSDCFVSASRAEGMPNAVLEAMACGLPVVLSDIGPHREILSFGPDAGMLFELDDTDRLSKLFRHFHPTPSVSSAALELAQRHFSASRTAALYQQAYLDLV